MRQIGGGVALALCLALVGAAYGQPADVAGNVTPYAPAFFAQYSPSTALDMVRQLPGFTFDGGSNERGFSGSAGNVLIDGARPPSRGDSLSSVLSRIPASAVERIDIIRGGAPGIDMQGRPLVANVIRKKGGGLSGSASASLQVDKKGLVSPSAAASIQNQTTAGALEGGLNYSSYSAAGPQTRIRTDPDGKLLVYAEGAWDQTSEELEATGSWESQLAGGKLRVNAKAGRERDSDTMLEQLITPGGVQDRGGRDTFDSGELGLRYSRDISDYSVEIVGFQSLSRDASADYFNTPDFTSGGEGERDRGESIARATIKTPAVMQVSFEAGGEAVYNYLDSESTRILDGGVFSLDGDSSHVDEIRTEGYALATWAPSSQLSVEAGVRYEWSRITAQVSDSEAETSLQFMKPRFNLSWTPAAGHQVGLRVERKVDQLDFNLFLSSASFDTEIFGIGNPNIEPGRRWNYEARYEWQLGGQNSFVAKLLHSDVDHNIAQTVVVLPPGSSSPGLRVQIPRNVQDAYGERLDLAAAFELDRIGLKGGLLKLNTMVQNSHTRDPVTGEERSLSNEQNWTWQATLSQNLGDGAFSWSIFASDFGSSTVYQPQSISKNQHGSNYGGATFSWRPTKGWTLSGSINRMFNLTDRRTFHLFDAPRDIGKLSYTERAWSPDYGSATLSLRKDF